jgi:hypothetical protein
MRYYRFNRDKSLGAVLQKRHKSGKKLGYMVRTNRSQMLDSFYFENRTWGALHKAWKGYVIAKNKDEFERMKYYAFVIQKLQKELGLNVASFPDLGLMALEDSSNWEISEEMTEEELLQEQMRQDREFKNRYKREHGDE